MCDVKCSKLLSTWVKAPQLRGAKILIASACLPLVAPQVYKQVAAEVDFVLLACPEQEPAAHYGKLASIIRSSRPKSITVVTVDGSPHCFALQAAVNEAEYILGEKVERRHYVVVDAKELVEIKPEAIRVARYLSLVAKIVRKYPEILEELKRYSLEHRQAERLSRL
ncbi:MAG TPA: 4Fe-4S ferredoxin [Pyrodictium sp.]|nr:4Fe-4S ferredoxin [Pyrodictium sp.]